MHWSMAVLDITSTSLPCVGTATAPEPPRTSRGSEHELLWLKALSVGTGDAQLALDQAGLCLFLHLCEDSLLDWTREDAIGRPMQRWIHREDRHRFSVRFARLLESPGRRLRLECRVRLECGLWTWVALTMVNLLDCPDARAVSVHVLDISERRGDPDRLNAGHSAEVASMEFANDGLWDWDLKNDELVVSPRWLEMLGYEPESLGTEPSEWIGRIHPEDRERFEVALTAHLRGESPIFEVDQRIRHADGSFRWVLCRGRVTRDADGRAIRIVGSQIDISSRKLRDPLTGLLNRFAFHDRIQDRLDRIAGGRNRGFALVVLDLDRFMRVNDSLGHSVGDEILCRVARRLEGLVRSGEEVSRLGGDEFGLLLQGFGDAGELQARTEEIHEALARPYRIGGSEAYSTASLGLALSEKGYRSAANMVRDADTAMSRAKSEGRDRSKTFRTVMREETVASFEMEVDLRRALEREEFCVRYQPIVDLDGGEVVAFESLVRWQHPTGGLVSPGEFIPLAEELGLIVDIDAWVLDQAAHRLSEWQRELGNPSALAISVNISGRHFRSTELVDVVGQLIETCDLDPRSLKLEITETAVVDNPRRASEMLRDLKKMGVRLALDDFGTGYSSLSHLHRFPFDIIKIDRSFISQMGIEGQNPGIVRTIISLAETMRMDVVAEGVETALQAEILRDLGCRYAQGFFFARPLEEADAFRLVEDGNAL